MNSGTPDPVGLFRVVIVDDDADVRSLLEVVFEVDGRFEVVGTAIDGAQGVALVERAQPDVVVLDLRLPVMDGLTAIPLLRRCAPHARIVVFSAFPDPFTLLDVLRRGADSYIDKAMAWSDLVPTITGLMGTPDELGPAEVDTESTPDEVSLV